MRFAISPEQLKFFHLNGYLEVENILTQEDVTLLHSKIHLVKKNSPGYPEENLFRSIPQIALIAKRRGIGQLMAELLHKKPLRLKTDRYFPAAPELQPMDSDACGLLLSLHSKKGLFFKQHDIPKELYQSKGDWLLLIITSNFLPTPPHPIL